MSRQTSSAASLHVGLLHFTSPPIVGGVEAIIGFQARGLRRRGHLVRAMAGRGGRFSRDIEYLRMPELDSKSARLLEINRELAAGVVSAGFERFVEELEQTLRARLADLDVCIIHNALTLHFHLPLTVALHRLAAGGARGLVGWCHDLSWTNPLYQDNVREGYPWTLLKRRAPGITYVVVSELRRAELAALMGVPPADLRVIPAGVSVATKLRLRRSTQDLLAAYELLEAEPFLLAPARITRRKNIELAIRVIAELRTLGLRPRLLVTGPRGPHDPASNAYVNELLALRASLGVQREVILLQAEHRPGHRP
ncbi:MAG: glycosyltransferase family 4 protein, partial [Chloroflexi bacterium]|nr:glycosyltransferase family 4 protein [Chloroflexota bacterium]